MNRFTNLILTVSLFTSNAKAFDMAECKKKAIGIARQEVQKAVNVVGVVELEDSSQAIGPNAGCELKVPFRFSPSVIWK